MIARFLTFFAQAKVNNAGTSLMQAIVRFDPETASEAQIAEFEEQLNALTGRVASLRREYRREQAEADAVNDKYNKYLAAAEKLNAQLTDPAKADQHAAITNSLTGVVTTLEALKPQVEAENKEAADAKGFLDEFEKAAKEAATKVTTARQKLSEAKRDMQKAALNRERAEDNAEHAAALAGIRKGNDSLGTALDAMNQAAQSDNDAAEALNLKASLLTQTMPKAVEDDPLVREALGEDANGAVQLTLEERLAALKK